MSDVKKVVIAGPFGAGKTTFVTTACTDALGFERAVSDETSRLKEQTTVALDHGTTRIRVDSSEYLVTLFGTPGQERFSFMWPILGHGMAGYVIVVDASRLQSQAQARGILKRFQSFAPDVPYVLAVNRWDRTAVSAADLATSLGVPEQSLVECDPRLMSDTSRALRAVVGHALRPAATSVSNPGSTTTPSGGGHS
ncbi:GTP-binding protein [Demequina flava]|uniref:GTP-binding protein n=1 Tax=Demequina flava TaxID=1095025 RepID=UPI0009E200E0|nr:ATP/GTP-binding protein [Demequina flava]